jgi:hypothetical protein
MFFFAYLVVSSYWNLYVSGYMNGSNFAFSFAFKLVFFLLCLYLYWHMHRFITDLFISFVWVVVKQVSISAHAQRFKLLYLFFFLSVSAIHSCMVYVHELVVYEYI